MPWAQGWTARAGLVRLPGAGSLAGSADCLGSEGGDALLPGRPGVLTGRKPLGVYDRIKRGAREVLAPFTGDDGTLEAPFRVHVVMGAPRYCGTRASPDRCTGLVA